MLLPDHAPPIIAILRGVTPPEVLDVAAALFQAGVRGIEVPLNSPAALESIALLSARFGKTCLCGAGTVLRAAAVDEVHAAGGRLIVAPNVDPGVIRRACDLSLTVIPGFARGSIFFEKKKQKTFGELDRSAPPQDNAPLIDKVFLLLFVHKKKILPAAQPIDLSEGSISLSDLAARAGLTKTTTHRLASALVERGYLSFAPREGYNLGPKLLELGYLASQKINLARIARPHLENLSNLTGDTVHLGIREGERALYLDKINGTRRVELQSRVGERQSLRSTGLGKALLLDETEATWRRCWEIEESLAHSRVGMEEFVGRMRDYLARGRTFDLEENEDRVRCVAAPVRDASGRIIAAISLSSVAQYMDDSRMGQLSGDVVATANAISRDLGWSEHSAEPPERRRRAK
jgi:DNA-binding IclR family transcriptional regulator